MFANNEVPSSRTDHQGWSHAPPTEEHATLVACDSKKGQQAEWLTLETLLSCYVRDFQLGALWTYLPRHDEALASALAAQQGTGCWFRLPFPASNLDAFCPVAHGSVSGRHRFEPPIILRHRSDGTLSPLTTATEAMQLVAREFEATAPLSQASAERAQRRLVNSRDNLAAILEHRAGKGFRSLADVNFLAAEQSLVTGHGAHPIPKSRWGFSTDDERCYSPERGHGFPLHYLLAHPDLVLEEQVRGPGLERLREELLADPETPGEIKHQLEQRASWRLLPLHPWEATWLQARPEIAAASASGALLTLGAAGKPFFATSSVRTVYRPGLPFSLKLSLHVAITNSERTNHFHELWRGCAVSRLLESPWGQRLGKECPAFHILHDSGFMALQWNGKMIDGTGVVLRANAFEPEDRVALLAAFCEPPLVEPTLLRTAIATTAAARKLPLGLAASTWLDRYLELLFDSVLGAYEHHGLALEIHQQNLLLQLDADGLPAGLFFRDNQGYFFRSGKRSELLRYAPDLDSRSTCILSEEELHRPFAYYLLVNNVLGLIEALSLQGLCEEPHALELLRAHLVRHLGDDTTGFVRKILTAQGWPAKANLRMTLENRDEARRPVDAPATYVDMPNPLIPAGHPCQGLIHPKRRQTLHQRAFHEDDALITIRALELDRDLQFIHDWVNQDYAKRFWCMDGPIQELEAFYIELLSSGNGNAFVGELAGRPIFVFESYWAPRDIVGRAYEARPGDYGFHMLTCPPHLRRPELTRRAFQATLELCFRHAEVERIVGEANRHNQAIDRLIRSVGYAFERVIQLPDKEANLTFCTRESFLAHCPDSRPFILHIDPREEEIGPRAQEMRV